MDVKCDYQRLLARALSGDDQEQAGNDAAVLGRRLAENEIGPADVARIHAAALDKHLAGQASDQRALALLQASRLLAEVMLWRGLSAGLLRHKQWADAELREVGRPLPLPPAGSQAEEMPPFRHPLAEATAFLERVAVTDPLTGIYNARHFHVAIEAQVQAAGESGSLLSLILLDVDALSRHNEVYGRRHGDEVLITMARLLMETTRRSDFVARCGGDEFAIILPHCTTRHAIALAERIRAVVQEHGFPDCLTASLGVATFPADAASDRELVNVTQQACYLAQRLGGNTVCTALVAEAEGIPAPEAEAA
ncbi:MAG TPA: GGDEF domain-containing protein [Armatimonadota bacterium]|nr:GGDEF domain-containing protein [Armatimonadota bacterium]